MKLLIIEDEKQVADNLKEGLEQHRFSVDIAYNGEDGYYLTQEFDYDIIILDLMLPGIDGEDLCRKLRDDKNKSFILMLTAKKQLDNIIQGLDCGADDYLTKPFEFSELLARIRALLRRSSEHKSSILSVSNISLDTGKEEVKIGDRKLQLTKKEYMILEYLLRNKGQLISRNQLLEHVWDRNVDIFTNVVDTHIKNLRKKLGRSGGIIKTIYGSGYRILNEETDT
ncbi:MAG: response regulator transcription factor [Actinomycetia bacterium]|nr:response regulator transcription factor [Actinomycetes bacterium]